MPLRCSLLFVLSPWAALALTLKEAEKLAPLPKEAQDGALLVDLNRDGHEDLLFSHPQRYGIYLFRPVAKKGLQWERGWTEVLREGVAGDASALPLLVDATGQSTGVHFKEDALRDAAGAVLMTREELLRVPGPVRLSAAESLKSLRMKPGYTATLVAEEPLVQDPVFVDWDEKGRMWVVEMGDYPFAPGEKTTDGQTGQGQVSPLQTGRIRVLEDSDGDSVYDKATLFLSGLKHPTGLHCWKGGVFVAAIPEVFYAKDVDGDGVCDVREPWLSGFTAGNPQHLVNGFCWGLDGWLYGANGDSGGEIALLKTGTGESRIGLGTHDFRFHPQSGEFRLETGRSQFGKWRDDYGNWFGNNNSTLGWHYFIPMSYLEAHPEKLPSSIRSVLNADGKVFPSSPPVRRFNQASATQVLTSACSLMPWQEMLLVCEPANNLVRRDLLDYSAFPLTSVRHPEDEGTEFLSSTDRNFRPVLAREGPDGALYVVDMYRSVLEHPEWIPTGIARGLDLRAGEEQGRIYRIAGPQQQKVASMSALPLQQAMRSSIRWQRDTAQRLLLEQQDRSAVAWLSSMAVETALPLPARVQAAWAAALLDEAQRPALIRLLEQGHPKVRGSARVAAGSSDIHPVELSSWFPANARPSAAVIKLPVLTKKSADRTKVVQEYLAKVGALVGRAERGEQVYERACMACHQLGKVGMELGPHLSTIAAKPVEQILEAIFDPNRAVEQRNVTTQLTRKDGNVLSGILTAETPSALVLRLPGGVDMPVLRRDIRELKTLPVSLMPEGLETVLTAQDTADLLARLRE